MADTLTTYDIGWPGSALGTASSNVGLRELLMNQLTDLSPQKTTTFSMLPKMELSQVRYSWLTDALAATSTAGSAEGGDFNDGTLSVRTRYYNNVCWFRKDFKISFTADDVAKRGMTGGVNSEYRHQLGKALIELRRNIDARIVANGTAVASASGIEGATAASDLPRTAVLRAWPIVATNVSGAFATAKYVALREAMDNEGAEPDTLLASTGVKLDISQLYRQWSGNTIGTANAGVVSNANLSDTRFSSVVSILEDDLGEVYLARDRFIPQATATGSASASTAAFFLIDRSKVSVGMFNGIRHIPLPPNGTAHRGIVEAVWGFKAAHPSAIGMGYNITT